MPYRSDIDGLRAIAVLIVMLFHFDVPGFSGGFIGVDVFFVISGYLITSIIWTEMREGRFSLLSFYDRRIRRIIPPLVTVMIVTLAIGFVYLLPVDLRRLAASALRAVFFVSNHYFAHREDYFEESSALSPLLHTWSLAVEEQFYLVFPLVLIALWRWNPKAVVPVLVVLAIVSLIASTSAVFWGHPRRAFYLGVNRAWELLAGSLLAVGLFRAPVSAMWRNAAAVAGAVLIAGCVVFYTRYTPFPGVFALLPCLGAILLIAAGSVGTSVVGRLLSTWPMVWTGKLSYSLYLWHWPLLALARTLKDEQLSAIESASLFVVSFVLSALTYKLVEQPARHVRLPARRQFVVASACIASVGLGFAGWLTERARGFPDRVPAAAADYATRPSNWGVLGVVCSRSSNHADTGTVCRFGRSVAPDDVRVVVWGDSHADALGYYFQRVATEDGLPTAVYRHAGCVPALGVDIVKAFGNPTVQGCREQNEAAFAAASAPAVTDVVLVARWSLYLGHYEPKGFLDHRTHFIVETVTAPRTTQSSTATLDHSLRRSISQLAALGKRVWLIDEVPHLEYSPSRRHAVNLMQGRGDTPLIGPPKAQHLERSERSRRLLQAQARDYRGVRVVDMTPVLCPTERCLVELDRRHLYVDDNHLSHVGVDYVAPVFEPLLAHHRP